jgi:hypothetical protein
MMGRGRRLDAWVVIELVAAAMGVFAASGPQVWADRAASAASPAAPAAAAVAQKFVCERGYVNFAFGYQSTGIYVDGRGDVYHYQFEDGARPWEPKRPDALTEQELEDKYRHGRKLLRTVEAKDLAAMIPLIAAASKGPYSKHESTGADRGGFGITCYLYNPTTQRYRDVEIEEEGDFTYKNLSPAAHTLARWVASLDPSGQ